MEDTLGAVDRLHRYFGPMTFEQFSIDPKTLAAINYELLVLGEAASRMPEEIVLAHAEIPWAELRGTRNVLVHGYFQLSLTTLWEISPNCSAAVSFLIEEGLDGGRPQ